jgi:hypothetical protein
MFQTCMSVTSCVAFEDADGDWLGWQVWVLKSKQCFRYSEGGRSFPSPKPPARPAATFAQMFGILSVSSCDRVRSLRSDPTKLCLTLLAACGTVRHGSAAASVASNSGTEWNATCQCRQLQRRLGWPSPTRLMYRLAYQLAHRAYTGAAVAGDTLAAGMAEAETEARVGSAPISARCPRYSLIHDANDASVSAATNAAISRLKALFSAASASSRGMP